MRSTDDGLDESTNLDEGQAIETPEIRPPLGALVHRFLQTYGFRSDAAHRRGAIKQFHSASLAKEKVEQCLSAILCSFQ